MTAAGVMSLQASAGNGAVAALLAKRRSAAATARQYLETLGEDETASAESEGDAKAKPAGAGEAPPPPGDGTGGGEGTGDAGEGSPGGEGASTGLRDMLDALATVRNSLVAPPLPAAGAAGDVKADGRRPLAPGAPGLPRLGGMAMTALNGLAESPPPMALAPTAPPAPQAVTAPSDTSMQPGAPPTAPPAPQPATAPSDTSVRTDLPPTESATPPIATQPATPEQPQGLFGLSTLVAPQRGVEGPEPPPPPPAVHKPPPEPAEHPAPAMVEATKALKPPKPSGHKGGGGAHKGGGGAPKVAKPSIGDPSLSKWKAATGSAVGAVAPPDMSDVKAGAEKLATTADEQDAKRQAEKKDFDQDAKAAVKPAPEPDAPEPFDTAPAKEAVRSVESVGEFRLPDQSLPRSEPPPAELTAIAQASVPPTQPMPTDARPAEGTKATDDQKVRMDPAADAMAQKLADIDKAPKPGEAAPITFHDKGPASLSPLSPEKADAVGDVIARMIAQADQHAKRISSGAKAKLAGGKSISALESLAKTDEGSLKDEIVTELKGIGMSAGATEEELNAKVATIDAATKKEGETAHQDVEKAGATGTAKVEKRGGEATAGIAGASETVKEEIEAKEITAQGSPDPAKVDAKRDEFIGKVESVVSAGTSRLKAVADKRGQDIDAAAQAQKSHYQSEGQKLRDALRRHYDKGDDASRTTAMVESRKATDWADKQIKSVDDKAAELKDRANELVKQATTRLREQGDKAKESIRDWAAGAQGKQRGWWDRLWDMFKDWGSQAKADNSAWEQQRNAESRDAIVSDMQLLTDVRTAIDQGNQAAIEEKLKGLDATQRELVMAYIKGGGQNGIGFVGMMAVGRLISRRVPELVTKWEDRAVADWPWLDLNLLAQARNPGFNASAIGNQVRGAVAVAGTDEAKLFSALGQAKSKVERAALDKFYLETFKTTIQADVKSDTEGLFGDSDEWKRAQALLEGKGDEADAAAIHDAISGWGTNEKAINDALRGKSDAERRAIIKAYKDKYGVDLVEDLKGDMEGAELDVATSLLAGDEDAATAAELENAMAGAGTDEAAITKAYERIREETEAKARAKGMSAAEVQAEVERRNAQVRQIFNEKYGKNWTGEGKDPLAAAMGEELGGAEHSLGEALAAGNQTDIDAAKARVEHESAYTDDTKIEDLLRHQNERAKTEVKLDNAANERYLKEQLGAGNLSEDQYKADKAALDEKKKGADEEIKKKASKYMGDLAKAYDDKQYTNAYDENGMPIAGATGDFERMLSTEVGSGGLFGDRNDEKVRKLYDNAGTMSPEDEIYYATTGAGTDEDRIKETLRGKKKSDIDKIEAAYNEAHKNDKPPGNFRDDILGDLGGRDDFDVQQLLKGEPETPEEALERARERAEYEKSGLFGSIFGDSLNVDTQTDTMATQLATFKDLDARKRAGEKLTPEEERQLEEANAAFDILKVGQEEAVEQHRAVVDDVTDMAAQVGAAVVGLAATIITGGGAAPLLAAGWAAAAGAAAGTAASIAIKAILKGAAYSYEDAAIEAGVGMVDATAQYFTAGLSNALKAMKFMEALAKKGLTGKALEFAIREGIQGAISGIPAAAAGAMAEEGLWHGDDPFQAFMEAVGTGMYMGAAMGVGMGGAMEGGEAALKAAGVELKWGGLGKKKPGEAAAGAGGGHGEHAEAKGEVKPAPVDVPPEADIDGVVDTVKEGKLPDGRHVPEEGKGPALGGDEVPPSPLEEVPIGKDEPGGGAKDEATGAAKDEKAGVKEEEKPGALKEESLGEAKDKLDAGAEEPPPEVKELLDALQSGDAPGTPLSDADLAQRMGIPEDAASKMRKFCEAYGVVLDVRPTNVGGLEMLANKLGLPKPEVLKNKTINALDVKLGISEAHKGKVGVVNPADMRLPDDFHNLPPKERAELIDRIEQRQKEWNEWQRDKKVQALLAEGVISVRDGVVYAGTGAEAKPFTGDHDIFNVQRADGRPMTRAEYDFYITQMRFWGMNVEHGAHLEWEPTKPKDAKMKKDIIAQHSPGGKEPLVRFGPDGSATTQWHTGPDHIEFAPPSSEITPGGKLGEDMSQGFKRPGEEGATGADTKASVDETAPPVVPKEEPQPKPFDDDFKGHIDDDPSSHAGPTKESEAMPFDPDAPPHEQLDGLVGGEKGDAFQTSSPTEANQLFQQAIRADPKNEYGVWYDKGSGQIIVNKGTSNATAPPKGEGPFVLLAHNHPGRAGQGTGAFYEPVAAGSKAARGDVVPSRKDVALVLNDVHSLGQGIEAKISVAGGEFTVTYSFDPHTKELRVTGPYGPNGAYETKVFKSIEQFREFNTDFMGKPKPSSPDPVLEKLWEQAVASGVNGPAEIKAKGHEAGLPDENDLNPPPPAKTLTAAQEAYKPCFLAGTLVDVGDGAVPIERLARESKVMGQHPAQAHTAGLYAVLATHRGSTGAVVEVGVDGATVRCTRQHLFSVVGDGWVPAVDLKLGHRLETATGRAALVSSVIVEHLPTDLATFNLSVETVSTYFVRIGGSSVLVHNGPTDDDLYAQPLFWILDKKWRLRTDDTDGLSVWRTESRADVETLMATRVKVDARGVKDVHSFWTPEQLKAAGLAAPETPGTGSLAEAGLQHHSLRPEGAADPSAPLTESQFAELQQLLEGAPKTTPVKPTELKC